MMLADSFGGPKTWSDVAYGAICPVCFTIICLAFFYFGRGRNGLEIEISTEAPKPKKSADPLSD